MDGWKNKCGKWSGILCGRRISLSETRRSQGADRQDGRDVSGCRLAFDTVGKFGYKMMMREVLKRHGMNDFGTLFYSGNARKELSGWSDDIVVSSRGYMLGYYDMKNPGVRGIHRFLAKAGDSLMKMQIVRVEFAGE